MVDVYKEKGSRCCVVLSVESTVDDGEDESYSCCIVDILFYTGMWMGAKQKKE
jgi:hypothetical protein